jgi:hypothetical protein
LNRWRCQDGSVWCSVSIEIVFGGRH